MKDAGTCAHHDCIIGTVMRELKALYGDLDLWNDDVNLENDAVEIVAAIGAFGILQKAKENG